MRRGSSWLLPCIAAIAGCDVVWGFDRPTFDAAKCGELDGLHWERAKDWTPGTRSGTTDGNPAVDADGRAVWAYERTMGGGLSEADAWYHQPPVLMTWDDGWYGDAGVWSFADDVPPAISQRAISQHADGTWSMVPRVRWYNTFDAAMTVELAGTPRIVWEGSVAAPSGAVDLAIARLDASGALGEKLVERTIEKPSTRITYDEIDIDLLPAPRTTLEPSESIVFSVRLSAPEDISQWIWLDDQITITVACE